MKGMKGRLLKKLKYFSDEDEKENIKPPLPKRKDLGAKNQDLEVFRRPDLNSSTLFDPGLLAAFQDALMDYKVAILDDRDEEQGVDDVVPLMDHIKDRVLEIRDQEQEEEEEDASLMEYKDGIFCTQDEEQEGDDDVPLMENEDTMLDARDDDEGQEGDEVSLMEFEERCPPGWMGSVILYTTSLRGIRKTFEECNSLRFLLSSLKVMFYERDVSMHMEFREELWRVLGGRAIPPRLFIKGRYIGGADEVQGLHEQGKLRTLLKGLPVDCSNGVVCEECGGMRFLVCSYCHGSRKKVFGDEVLQCFHCNENGLVLCSLCC